MKKPLSVLAFLVVLFASQISTSSCTKTVTKIDTVTKTVTKTDTVNKTDTVTQILPDNSVAKLLFGKQWIVDSLYESYSAGNPGTIVYVRGGTGNSQNLDNYLVVMWPGGEQLFSNGSNYTTFTYSFRSADSINLLINNPSPDYARIVHLSTNYMTIYDSTNSALSYYKYKP